MANTLKPLFGGKKSRLPAETSIIPEGMKGGVFYIRVSTGKQEEKGNGLESQKETILTFAKNNDVFQIGEFYMEIGSGGATLDKRPILSEAIETAKKHNAYLITSKLDRLSRKAAMVSNMLEDNFKFVTVEHGFKTEDLFIRILAALAQKERELIGERTAAGLKQVKKRYEEQYQKQIEEGIENPVRKRLGIPSVADAPTHISHQRREEGLARSKKYIEEMIDPCIVELKAENHGKKPNRKLIAERMNQKGFKTEYGSPWSESIIYHTMRKIKVPKEVPVPSPPIESEEDIIEEEVIMEFESDSEEIIVEED